jgi:hypothetical protein
MHLFEIETDPEFFLLPIFFELLSSVYEVFERMAFYGISSNLVLYLTTKMHQGVVVSANNVTNWVGTIWMTPIVGAYVADAHLGRYRTFMAASVIYLCVSRRRPRPPPICLFVCFPSRSPTVFPSPLSWMVLYCVVLAVVVSVLPVFFNGGKGVLVVKLEESR